MTISRFLLTLAEAAQNGYRFSLGESLNLGPQGERRPRWMLRCYKIRGKRLHPPDILPVEAVYHYVTGELPRGHVPYVAAAEILGLSGEARGMILRAGEQIVCFKKGEKEPYLKYSTRLRRDMLEACAIEEKCSAKKLFSAGQ